MTHIDRTTTSLAAVVVVVLFGACGGDTESDGSDRKGASDADRICDPGARRSCPCEGASSTGRQRCHTAGTGWSPCRCPSEDDGESVSMPGDAGVEGSGDAARPEPECSGPECTHRVFVTSRSLDGNRGGLGGADTLCNNAAEEAGLEGNWKAILSKNDTIARDRLTIRGPVENIAGETVADDASDLWDGTLDTVIDVDEHGESASGHVWTGTDSQGGLGGLDANCNGWNTGDETASGVRGSVGQTDGDWLDAEETLCDSKASLYCIDGQ